MSYVWVKLNYLTLLEIELFDYLTVCKQMTDVWLKF